VDGWRRVCRSGFQKSLAKGWRMKKRSFGVHESSEEGCMGVGGVAMFVRDVQNT
jgi:hypothetical protein